MDSLLKNKHLMSRAGFGISIDQADYINEQTPKKISETLFREYPFTEIFYQTPDYIKTESNDPKLYKNRENISKKTII